MWKLLKLNLSNNYIKRQQLFEQKDLIYLSMRNNRRFDFCHDFGFYNIHDASSYVLDMHHAKLKVLDLSGTATNSLCFDKLEAIEYLDLSGCNVLELKFNALPVSHAPQLIVNLEENTLRDLSFDETDYNMLVEYDYHYKNVEEFKRGMMVILATIEVECDCGVGWLARALHNEAVLNISNLLCSDGSQLRNSTSTECEMWICAEGCICRRYWDSNATDVDCSSASLDSIPIPLTSGLRALNVSHNLIRVFNAKNLPESIIQLDISANQISLLDTSTTTAIFSVGGRQVRLAGNPILCSCENQLFIQQLHSYSNQVQDYEEILCTEDGKPVSKVIPDLLCTVRSDLQYWLMGGIGTFILLAALTALVYCRYERQLRVLLYAHKWCLWYVSEEELDSDRLYDAFVSFSRSDEQYVMDELVPGLERAPHSYRVCVHYQDCVPEELIPLQISRSIELSHRTVIVMSKNYLKSKRGQLEFRAAHEDTSKSGRSRIIVVLLEDVRNEVNLDSELRTYLNNNTYLKHKDPWFWNKLRYALRHRVNNLK